MTAVVLIHSGCHKGGFPPDFKAVCHGVFFMVCKLPLSWLDRHNLLEMVNAYHVRVKQKNLFEHSDMNVFLTVKIIQPPMQISCIGKISKLAMNKSNMKNLKSSP